MNLGLSNNYPWTGRNRGCFA